MKKNFYLFVAFVLSTSAACAQYTAIPDTNFETALSEYDDIPGDNKVPTANISELTTLIISSKEIADLTGIEDFTALETLNCYDNSLTTIDLSKNTNLVTLNCSKNSLTALDITNNILLKYLYFSYNYNINTIDFSQNVKLNTVQCHSIGVTSFDITKNVDLEDFQAAYADITELDVTNNLKLKKLSIQSSDIKNIDLSKNTALTFLQCAWSKLTTLDLSNNLELTGIVMSVTDIKEMDFSKHTKLSYFVGNSKLEYLNLKNGNNKNFTTPPTYSNSLLTCVQVDDPVYSAENWSDNNGQIIFSSEPCSSSLTYVPDDNFEQALIDLGYDNGLNNYVLTSNISELTTLTIKSKEITDLTGIEDFTALENLNCYDNSLSTIDLSKNTKLVTLNCSKNSLTALDITNNILLKYLYFSYNYNINTIDFSQNVKLNTVQCHSIGVTSFDITKNVDLEDFQAAYADITELDVTNNLKLKKLSIQSSDIKNIDLSKNTALTFLQCAWSKLTTLDLSNNLELTGIVMSVTDIKEMDFSKHTKLSYFAGNSKLEYLNLKNGNNKNFTTPPTYSNSLLTCVQVDDPVYSAENWSDNNGQITFSLEACPTLGIDSTIVQDFTIYPNPVNSTLFIKTNKTIDTYSLMNQLGTTVLKGSGKTIDVSQLASGIYYIKVLANNIWQTRKIVVE